MRIVGLDVGEKRIGIAVSDVTGGLYNAKGLDIPELLRRFRGDGQPLRETKMGDWISNEELLELDCTVLVPAALSEQITHKNAAKVRCRILAEGANGPTTLDADQILVDKGVFIIPDILANSGGVIVSYFEWVQDLQAFFWEEEEINTKLHHVITRAFYEILHTSVNKRVDMRNAAYALAVQRVANATTVRGIYP